MRLSDLWSRSANRVLVSLLCLIALSIAASGAITSADLPYSGRAPDVGICLAEPLQGNDANYALFAAAGSPPVIQVFTAAPMVLEAADSSAVYTFKVKNALNVVITEDGNTIREITNPTLAALNGTATGLPAGAITPDASGQFTTVLVASNESGSVQAELTLALAADLLPEEQAGPTDNRTGQRTPQWGPLTRAPITSTPSNIINEEPAFFKCPSDCDHCLKPDEAVRTGYSQRCSEELCYYSPDKQQKWYCYKPTPGWCCANQQVSQSTKSECDRMQGFWSTNQYEALDACQPRGYCCIDGQIYYPVTESDCRLKGGSYWSTSQAQTAAYCRQQQTCWCCVKGQVFETTQDRCIQAGGACYSTQSQAAAACYEAPPPIRYPNLK